MTFAKSFKRFGFLLGSLIATLGLINCGTSSTNGGGGHGNSGPVISTFAGNGTLGDGGDGGPATSAEINSPYGVSVDASGNIYIADTNNGRVRKVDPSGKITTVAGSGAGGYSGDGGPATSAALWSPTRAVSDRAGNIYITDFYNNRLRKVDTSGIITTIAGTGVAGYNGDGIPAITAELNLPEGVAVDAVGNIYVCDVWNHRIREIDSSGTISTIAGSDFPGSLGDGGPATSAQLDEPEDVAVDSHGNIYIADYGNSAIRKVDASGTISTIAGMISNWGYRGDGGSATSAFLNFPTGVTVDNTGNVYIADYQNNRVRKVDTSGTITTIAGTAAPSLAETEVLPRPQVFRWKKLLWMRRGTFTSPTGTI